MLLVVARWSLGDQLWGLDAPSPLTLLRPLWSQILNMMMDSTQTHAEAQAHRRRKPILSHDLAPRLLRTLRMTTDYSSKSPAGEPAIKDAVTS